MFCHHRKGGTALVFQSKTPATERKIVIHRKRGTSEDRARTRTEYRTSQECRNLDKLRVKRWNWWTGRYIDRGIDGYDGHILGRLGLRCCRDGYLPLLCRLLCKWRR